MKNNEGLTGLIAAPHTPFDENGEIAYEVISQQAEFLIGRGVTGVYISGSTGEGISCSVAERLKVMEEWHRVAGNRLKMIVHIGALALKDVEVLGRRADELGVFAVSVVPAAMVIVVPAVMARAAISAVRAASTATATVPRAIVRRAAIASRLRIRKEALSNASAEESEIPSRSARSYDRQGDPRQHHYLW